MRIIILKCICQRTLQLRNFPHVSPAATAATVCWVRNNQESLGRNKCSRERRRQISCRGNCSLWTNSANTFIIRNRTTARFVVDADLDLGSSDSKTLSVWYPMVMIQLRQPLSEEESRCRKPWENLSTLGSYLACISARNRGYVWLSFDASLDGTLWFSWSTQCFLSCNSVFAEFVPVLQHLQKALLLSSTTETVLHDQWAESRTGNTLRGEQRDHWQ